MKAFLKKRIVDPIFRLLKQGISPEKIALGLAVGLVIGIFPVIGATTLMCTIMALVLRLNLPAIQLVNYLVYPVQIALLIPFFQFGAWLFGMEPLSLSGGQIVEMFQEDFWGAIIRLWDTTMRAIVAWSVICLPALGVVYFSLKPLIRRMKANPAGTPT